MLVIRSRAISLELNLNIQQQKLAYSKSLKHTTHLFRKNSIEQIVNQVNLKQVDPQSFLSWQDRVLPIGGEQVPSQSELEDDFSFNPSDSEVVVHLTQSASLQLNPENEYLDQF